jgi:formiminotetrahydrofolate cyclodeaminase
VPARLTDLAAEIAELAAQATERGKPKLRGDAAAGAVLAEAAAKAAANLVAINCGPGSSDRRIERASTAAGMAGKAAGRAVAASRWRQRIPT